MKRLSTSSILRNLNSPVQLSPTQTLYWGPVRKISLLHPPPTLPHMMPLDNTKAGWKQSPWRLKTEIPTLIMQLKQWESWFSLMGPKKWIFIFLLPNAFWVLWAGHINPVVYFPKQYNEIHNTAMCLGATAQPNCVELLKAVNCW